MSHSRGIPRAWIPWVVLLVVIVIAGILVYYVATQPTGTGIVEVYKPVKPKIVDHTEFFKEENIVKYEGSKTCIKCHEDDVLEVFHSYHYQLVSENTGINGKTMAFGGKLAFNDYCMAMFLENGTKVLNWIGYVKLKKTPPGYENLVGSFTGLTGCSMCHGVGMGLPPSPEPTEEQLHNIDCLACHAKPDVYLSGPVGIKKGYKNVTKDEKGRWRYVVNIPIDKIAKSIIDIPYSQNCLACHAFSGGGPHLKRPNIGPDLMDPELAAKFDVHFREGLGCVDCHRGGGHEFATSAADTWSREGEAVECSDCHGENPHRGIAGLFLNKFHERVACQTCHIPYIAHGEYPTEYYRDWSKATFKPELKRWKFSIPDPETGDTSKWHLFSNLKPVYAWYNGNRQVYVYPEKVDPIPLEKVKEKIGGVLKASEIKAADGTIVGAVYYVKPLGSRDDPESKIYPFRVHAAVIPYSKEDRVLVPGKVGIAFATGDVKKAFQVGAKAAGVKWDGQTYILYIRYMQVNHGVQPAEKALECLDCHGPTVRRMPWGELGYGVYPEVAFTTILTAIIVVILLAAWKIYTRVKSARA